MTNKQLAQDALNKYKTDAMLRQGNPIDHIIDAIAQAHNDGFDACKEKVTAIIEAERQIQGEQGLRTAVVALHIVSNNVHVLEPEND